MRRGIVLAACVAIALSGVTAVPAVAQRDYLPRKSACTADPLNYACLRADTRRAAAGEPVLFTGTLSAKARTNLASWTAGGNTVCLTRYEPRPRSDGWPSQTLDQACTVVNSDGTFGLTAELGKQGLHFYGVTMGPCKASKAECGNADPGLMGPGNTTKNRVVAVRTLAP